MASLRRILFLHAAEHTPATTMNTMKRQDSLEALYALIFAVCVLLALFLLVG